LHNLNHMNVNRSVKDLNYPEYAGIKKPVRLDLSLNENQFVSQKVLQHIRKLESKIGYYQLAQDSELILKIAKKFKINKNQILLTEGCDGALHHIAESFLGENDRVVIPIPTFGRYEFHTKIMGAKPIFINFTNFPFEFDLNKIKRQCLSKRVKLIFLCNPNNPTGHHIKTKIIDEFLQGLRSTIVVIDEALADYLGDTSISLVNKYQNLIVTRSFSKFYGLAGLRIGYLISNARLIKQIAKTISPFALTSLSIEAAKAVLDDKRFIDLNYQKFKESLDYLKNNLKLNFPNLLYWTNSSTSTILICASNFKRNLYSALLKNGILTVPGKDFRGLEKQNCVRISIQDLSRMEKLIDTLKSIFNIRN